MTSWAADELLTAFYFLEVISAVGIHIIKTGINQVFMSSRDPVVHVSASDSNVGLGLYKNTKVRH